MSVVAVYSVKGGVGKTTLASNLAWCSAALSGRDTVLWDLDASGGAAYILGAEGDPKNRAESLFTVSADPETQLVKTVYHGLSILPADESIRNIDTLLARIGRRKHIARIINSLSHRHDTIILDCPPTISELSRQILKASDVVIVPLPPSPLSARAFKVVANEVQSLGKLHPPILPVLSMVDMRRTLHRDAKRAAPNWPVIPFSSVAEQCAVRHQPVGVFARNSPTSQGIENLWGAIERKLAERQPGFQRPELQKPELQKKIAPRINREAIFSDRAPGRMVERLPDRMTNQVPGRAIMPDNRLVRHSS